MLYNAMSFDKGVKAVPLLAYHHAQNLVSDRFA